MYKCTVPLWLFGDVYRPTVWEWFPIKTCYFRNWIDACRTFYVWKSITMCIIYIPDIMKILAKVVTFILASIVYFIYSLFLFLFPLISADFLVHGWRTPPIFCMSSLPFLNVQNIKFHCHRPIIKEFPHMPHSYRCKMAPRRITALCKCNVIYIRQVRVKHLELTLGYMGNFFNNGYMTMTFHILKMLYDLESHAKDGRCG